MVLGQTLDKYPAVPGEVAGLAAAVDTAAPVVESPPEPELLEHAIAPTASATRSTSHRAGFMTEFSCV
jgi:hypothetical protein